MPLYIYKCNNCEEKLEARQKFTDDPLTECPNCEDGKIRRVINNVGVVFKGSGFYVNDNKSNNPAGTSTNGKSESDGSATSSDNSGKESSASSSETKSEKKEASSSTSSSTAKEA